MEQFKTELKTKTVFPVAREFRSAVSQRTTLKGCRWAGQMLAR